MWHLQKIPRIAHFYWGNATLSYLRYLTVLSFQRLNPDWQVKIYYPRYRYQGEKTWSTYEHSVRFSGENYMKYLKQLPGEHIEVDFDTLGFRNDVPENFKSDFLCWYLLGSQGGLWSDFDILFFRPLDELYLNIPDATEIDTVICHNQDKGLYSVGFLMSSENNPFYSYIASKALNSLRLNVYESVGPLLVGQLFPEASTIKQQFPSLTIINMKMEVVYPFRFDQVITAFHRADIELSPDTIGVHWYAGYPQAGEFENLVTKENAPGFAGLARLLRS